MNLSDHQSTVIRDLQQRVLEKGALIVDLRAQVQKLEDELERKRKEIVGLEMQLDQQLREFRRATLRYHLQTWLRKIW